MLRQNYVTEGLSSSFLRRGNRKRNLKFSASESTDLVPSNLGKWKYWSDFHSVEENSLEKMKKYALSIKYIFQTFIDLRLYVQ